MIMRKKKSFEEAAAAALKLSSKLGAPDWLLGVSIEADADVRKGFFISVRVATLEVEKGLPTFFEGVPVKVELREIAKAGG